MVSLLLEYQADPRSTDFFPATSRDIAQRASRHHLVALMDGCRDFGKTRYKESLAGVATPTTQDELRSAVKGLLHEFATEHTLSPNEADTLYHCLVSESPGTTLAAEIEVLWTSAQTWPGRDNEFCHIVNWALWMDRPQHVAVITRALSLFLVTGPRKGLPTAVSPPNRKTFRGGGFSGKQEHKDFFRKGLLYRTPPVLPTTGTESKAGVFMSRSTEKEKILWTFEFPIVCDHVYHIQKRALGVPDEDEWLFAAYSVFEVLKVDWKTGTLGDHHEVVLSVKADNAEFPDNMPCAPWC